MRKAILIFCLFVSGCVHSYQGTLNYIELDNDIKPSDKITFILPADYSTDTMAYKPFVQDFVKQKGWKITDNEKKTKYVTSFMIKKSYWQTPRQVAVYGPTSVRSVDTNSYGFGSGNYNSSTNMFLNGNQANAYSSGQYNSNIYTHSQANVQYNEGIVGYRTVIDNHNLVCFLMKTIKVNKNQDLGEPVISSDFCINDIADEQLFMTYVQSTYNNFAFVGGYPTKRVTCKEQTCFQEQ